jgi:GT2 family glycosyltransferase
MLSIVICSINPDLARQVSANIGETVGIPFELLIYNNKELNLGITAVYELGTQQARYPFLCFVHEDVAFTTANWGRRLLQYFEDRPGAGAIGVAGARYKSRTPSGWHTSVANFDFVNISHHNGKTVELHKEPEDCIDPLVPVVSLDGVFICTTKENLKQIPWDAVNLKHFHLYDIDISTRLFLAGKANYVTFEIQIVHFTQGGAFSNDWVRESISWHTRMATQLPAFTSDLNLEMPQIKKLEKSVAKTWLLFLRGWPIQKHLKINWLVAASMWRKPALWPAVFLFLFRIKLKSSAPK